MEEKETPKVLGINYTFLVLSILFVLASCYSAFQSAATPTNYFGGAAGAVLKVLGWNFLALISLIVWLVSQKIKILPSLGITGLFFVIAVLVPSLSFSLGENYYNNYPLDPTPHLTITQEDSSLNLYNTVYKNKNIIFLAEDWAERIDYYDFDTVSQMARPIKALQNLFLKVLYQDVLISPTHSKMALLASYRDQEKGKSAHYEKILISSENKNYSITLDNQIEEVIMLAFSGDENDLAFKFRLIDAKNPEISKPVYAIYNLIDNKLSYFNEKNFNRQKAEFVTPQKDETMLQETIIPRETLFDSSPQKFNSDFDGQTDFTVNYNNDYYIIGDKEWFFSEYNGERPADGAYYFNAKTNTLKKVLSADYIRINP